MTIVLVPGFFRASCRITCRDFESPVFVTVHVLTIHRSADSSSVASRYPLARSDSRTSWVSYWFTLQPKVTSRAVRSAVTTREVLNSVRAVPQIVTTSFGFRNRRHRLTAGFRLLLAGSFIRRTLKTDGRLQYKTVVTQELMSLRFGLLLIWSRK